MSNQLPRQSPSSLVPHSCRKNILASILGGWVKSAYFTFEEINVYRADIIIVLTIKT